jgi:hypothetical protein
MDKAAMFERLKQQLEREYDNASITFFNAPIGSTVESYFSGKQSLAEELLRLVYMLETRAVQESDYAKTIK